MRTKVFRATCPRRVLWGDPVYLAGDTVDTAASVIKEQSIPESFQAKIILEERHDEEYIDVVMLNVGIYMAREQQLPMYLKNTHTALAASIRVVPLPSALILHTLAL